MQAAIAAEQAKALARGKRAKLRRAKEKYRDQDEEDRALALEVLAPAGEHPISHSSQYTTQGFYFSVIEGVWLGSSLL